MRSAVRSELAGYWTWAVRRPWLWLDRDLQELAIVTMARARHALRDGELVSKTAVLDDLAAPPWLARAIRARRAGTGGRSPFCSHRSAASSHWRGWDVERRTHSRQRASAAALSEASPRSKSLPTARSKNSRPASAMTGLRRPDIVHTTRV